MAQFNAEAQDVVDSLAAQVGFLTKENAILTARLQDAARQLDGSPEDTAIPDQPAPTE